ncbi:hypothetical protein TrVFT333_006368 [Trichoderma virens FT-333]|nr:hypothetical protein TrVFT333_006368 [Trichoderma virens FT-333]
MKVTRAISLTNFMVATSALGFQVFVLYPWHKELDNGFEDLKKEHMKVLEAVGKSVSEQQRMAFSNRLNELKTESSRRWWWIWIIDVNVLNYTIYGSREQSHELHDVRSS